MKLVCLAANPSVDQVAVTDAVRTGEIHRTPVWVRVAGGKTLNAARAAARLGAQVEVVAILGGHTGRWVHDALLSDAIPTTVIDGEAQTRCALSVAGHDDGGLTEFYESGGPIEPTTWDRALQAAVARLDPGDWLVLSGSLPPGAPADGYAQAIVRARTAGAHAALDASGARLRHGAAASPRLVKVNAQEASDLLGLPVGGLEQAADAAVRIQRASGSVASVTCGRAGAAVCDGTDVLIGSTPSQGIHSVGCGDVFLAAMVVALATGRALDAALRSALGAAAANAIVPGPGTFSATDAVRAAEGADVGVPVGRGS